MIVTEVVSFRALNLSRLKAAPRTHTERDLRNASLQGGMRELGFTYTSIETPEFREWVLPLARVPSPFERRWWWLAKDLARQLSIEASVAEARQLRGHGFDPSALILAARSRSRFDLHLILIGGFAVALAAFAIGTNWRLAAGLATLVVTVIVYFAFMADRDHGRFGIFDGFRATNTMKLCDDGSELAPGAVRPRYPCR